MFPLGPILIKPSPLCTANTGCPRSPAAERTATPGPPQLLSPCMLTERSTSKKAGIDPIRISKPNKKNEKHESNSSPLCVLKMYPVPD